VIRNGPRFLVEYYEWPTPDDKFYRPLGGGIAFGEYGEDVIKREFREGIFTEIENVRYLGMIENIFEYRGETGHEIVLIYEADFVDQSMYSMNEIEGLESTNIKEGKSRKVLAYWKTIEEIEEDGLPLFPERLTDFLEDIGWLKK